MERIVKQIGSSISKSQGGQMGDCSLMEGEPEAMDDTTAGRAAASQSRATSHCSQARQAEQAPAGAAGSNQESKSPENFVVTRQGQDQALLWLG